MRRTTTALSLVVAGSLTLPAASASAQGGIFANMQKSVDVTYASISTTTTSASGAVTTTDSSSLYPTVMLLSRFLGPQLDRLGAEPWLAMWLSEVASVSALQWLLMPFAAARMRRWLDPVDGAGPAVTLRGAAVVVAVYAVTLTIFATVTWLQFWDYR